MPTRPSPARAQPAAATQISLAVRPPRRVAGSRSPFGSRPPAGRGGAGFGGGSCAPTARPSARLRPPASGLRGIYCALIGRGPRAGRGWPGRDPRRVIRDGPDAAVASARQCAAVPAMRGVARERCAHLFLQRMLPVGIAQPRQYAEKTSRIVFGGEVKLSTFLKYY